jgi:streptogramin lyase
MRLRLATTCPFALISAVCLAGCSLATTATPSAEAGLALQGSVHGGQQPVAAAQVYLLAAGTGGYGAASSSLISSGAAGTSSIGSYVLTDAAGHFSITGDYTCTLGQQVYIYALGGNPGAGTNSASGMMAAIGACPSAGNFLASVPYITVNELSTVALAYSVSGFAVDPLHVASSATALAKTGIANAFANSANLAALATGVALAATPAGNGAVPRSELNTLANILAACMNTNGTIAGPSSPTLCYTLVNNAKNGSTIPTDTAGAAINIAHNPTANIAALFNLQTASAPFLPALATAPNDFTVNLTFTGGGLGTSTTQSQIESFTMNNIAIDAAGNVWKPNYGNNTLTELNPLGAPLSGSGGFTGGGLSTPANVAVDLSGNIWVGNFAGNSVSKFAATGIHVAGSPFSGGGISSPANLAVDASGNVWIANTSSLSKLTSAGVPATGSPYSSNSITQAVGIAVATSGNVWVTDGAGGTIGIYTSSGTAATGSPFTSGLVSPYGLAFDSAGYGWAADTTDMVRLSPTGSSGTSPYNLPHGGVPMGVALDGLGNAWTSDELNGVVDELNTAGAFLSGAFGFQHGQSAVPEAVAVDGSGDVWYSTFNDATIHELVGAAAPVVTPLAYGVKNSLLGTRP